MVPQPRKPEGTRPSFMSSTYLATRPRQNEGAKALWAGRKILPTGFLASENRGLAPSGEDAAGGTQNLEFEIDDPRSAPLGEPETLSPAIKLDKRGVTSHVTPPLGDLEIRTLQVVVSGKLRKAGEIALAEPLELCGTLWSVALCNGCGSTRKFTNRCERFYCPRCQPRLSRERKQTVEWWTKLVRQPKHVVLTVRNTERLSQTRVRDVKDAFSKLRRSKFASNWRGGFYALEVTNEGRGWHLHIHALIDADWIESRELARQWAKRVGQSFAIVKVQDCRGESYLREVTKYAVKGSTLASWSAEQITEFVLAFSGTKTFGVFGELYRARAEWSAWVEETGHRAAQCECGCTTARIMSLDEWEWYRLTHEIGPPQVKAPEPQGTLL